MNLLNLSGKPRSHFSRLINKAVNIKTKVDRSPYNFRCFHADKAMKTLTELFNGCFLEATLFVPTVFGSGLARPEKTFALSTLYLPVQFVAGLLSIEPQPQ